MTVNPLVLLVGSGELVAPVVAEIERELPAVTTVVATVADAATTLNDLRAVDRPISLLVAIDVPVDELIAVTGPTRVLLLTPEPRLTGLDAAVSAGTLVGVVSATWTPGEFARHLAAQIRRGDGAAPTPDLDRAPALEALEADDAEVSTRLVTAIERALGPRPRLLLRAGATLVREGEQVNAVFIVEDGDIELSRRAAHGEQVLHRNSSGGVVGMLSFTQQRAAFVTAVAAGPVTAIHLTLEQLDQAMRHDPEVSTLFSALLLRALAKRLVRADELHLELRTLNRTLAAAEVRLIDSARMATLGELSAGVAHELNNPVGALARAADHVATDLGALLDVDDRAVFDEASTASPISTSELRRRRRELAAALSDDALADRLARAGVATPAEANRLVAAGAAALDRRVRLWQLGTSVRNAASATDRITGIVSGLRSYVRDDTGDEVEVDVREGLDDTLRLLGHRLDGVQVERRYDDVPTILGRPGELNQVWTNLLVNALDALDGRPAARIDVVVDRHGGDVRVRIVDNGPGIPADVLDRIFEPRFTTKGGRVEFGLGLGLSIARRIVDDHAGTIELASGDATTATVLLPRAVLLPVEEGA